MGLQFLDTDSRVTDGNCKSESFCCNDSKRETTLLKKQLQYVQMKNLELLTNVIWLQELQTVLAEISTDVVKAQIWKQEHKVWRHTHLVAKVMLKIT